MNEELAYRTIAYLIGHYKTNDETTMNREEIAAINFILSENQQLKEKLDLSEKARKEAIDYIKELYDNTDDTTCYDIDKDEKERLLEILDIDKGDEQ